MTRKNETAQEPPKRGMPKLVVSRAQAESQISERIVIGRKLLQRPIESGEQLESARIEYRKWDRYNSTLLHSLFDSPGPANEYNYVAAVRMFASPYLHVEVKDYRDKVQRGVTRLESLVERLPFYEAPTPVTPSTADTATAADTDNSQVFVVHGRDELTFQTTARLLTVLGLEPVILRELPVTGGTIIDDIEHNSDVGYAIVLMTPDDLGKLASEVGDPSPRARQNVVFELGYFVGRLGRRRVCLVCKPGVEMLSDYYGVRYVSLDDDDWHRKVAKALDAAGYNIDYGKVF